MDGKSNYEDGVVSLYQCEKCGAKENTALGSYWGKDKKICSECYSGKWHNKFPKEILLPIGMFVTNDEGNLKHKETGETDLSNYVYVNIERPQHKGTPLG